MGIEHDSDCSLHNEPAMPNGPCDCSAWPYLKGKEEAWLSPSSRNPYDRGTDEETAWFVGRDDAVRERIGRLEAMLRAAGYNDEQIKAGSPYIEVMGG